MSQIGTVTTLGAENPSDKTPAPTRAAAILSFLMGFTGLAYWVPALFGASPAGAGGDHPVAFIQRVASMALEQYTPGMSIVIPILGALFSIASALQIPGGLGTLTGRRWAMLLLRAVAYTKVALYVAAGLLLGLAIFSSVEANRPSWNFAVANWIASLAMIGIYYWIILAINAALSADDPEAAIDYPEEEPLPTRDPFTDRPTSRY